MLQKVDNLIKGAEFCRFKFRCRYQLVSVYLLAGRAKGAYRCTGASVLLDAVSAQTDVQ